MDSLTHAFITSAIAIKVGKPELIPLGIIGAIIPDIDILFKRFSDPFPQLYIFTHGGFSHSFIGATTLAIIVYPVIMAATSYVPLFALSQIKWGILPFLAIIGGAIGHAGIDFISSPGVPLLYPFSDRKITLNIFAGPSLFMFVVSITYLELILLGRASLSDLRAFIAIFLLLFILRFSLKLYVRRKVNGTIVPTPNLLTWFIINDEDDSVMVRQYHVFKGVLTNAIFQKLNGITPTEVNRYLEIPEVKRHRFYSHIVTVDREDNMIHFHDPLRELGYLWYPPYYKTLDIDNEKVAKQSGVK